MDEQMMRATLAAVEGEETFEELIAGKYREDFTRKVQQLMDRRFAQHRQMEEDWQRWTPAVQKLCTDRGIDPDDPAALTDWLEGLAGQRERQDWLRAWCDWQRWTPAVQKLCTDRGIDPDDPAALTDWLEGLAGQRERQDWLRAWCACQSLKQWLEEASTLGERYPTFDLGRSIQDAGFLKHMRQGLSLREAWELCHRDELMLSAMEATAAHVRELTARSQLQRQSRPREGGMMARSATVMRPRMQDATRAQREELERRALRGERIVL